jgi:hypothetical protein
MLQSRASYSNRRGNELGRPYGSASGKVLLHAEDQHSMVSISKHILEGFIRIAKAGCQKTFIRPVVILAIVFAEFLCTTDKHCGQLVLLAGGLL